MATVTRTRLGPADQGRRLTLEEYLEAEWEEGYIYELARGVLVVTEVPRPYHGRIVLRVARMFYSYDLGHPGVINYQAGGNECRLRLRGLISDRHPDQAVYLDPEPQGPRPWERWVPTIVIEVVSPSSRDRDYVEKREEYHRFGVREYWVLDPARRRLLVLHRAADEWDETVVAEAETYRTPLLPGLEFRPADLIGPPEAEAEAET